MCGIAGWIDWPGDITEKIGILRKMKDVLSHRGPDEAGEWYSRNAGLVHRRLIVIDPAGGKQPMIRELAGKQYVLVYNGELYNTEEIREKLLKKGYSFKGHSDTEVLLMAYLEWGEDSLEHLNGIYAFAVWDEQEQSLFLARDRLGVKPLFFARLKNGLLFASELKAIIGHPAVEPRLTQEGLAEIITIGPGRTPGRGIFAGVEELKPGYYLTYNQGGISLRQYWKLVSKPHQDCLTDTVERVRELFVDSVERQLVSDMPICTLLSGGLDSSAISAVASPALRERGFPQLHTYSVDYEGNEQFFRSNSFQPDSDHYWVEQVAQAIDSRHHQVLLSNEQLVKGLSAAVYARDLPGMADIDVSLYLFAREIKKDFVVAVSGECADEIFGGYPWFYQQGDLEAEFFPWTRFLAERMKLFSPEVIAIVQPEEYIKNRYREALAEVPLLPGENRAASRVRAMFYLNLTRWMAGLLERKDRMSMYTGLEIRVPFCDHRLVEYTWNIPWWMKNYGEQRKGILRAALRGILSERVRNRPKNPYPRTFNPAYFRATRDWLREILANRSAPLLKIVNVQQVKQLTDWSQDLDLPWFGQLMRLPQLFAYLIQLNIWLEEYRISIL